MTIPGKRVAAGALGFFLAVPSSVVAAQGAVWTVDDDGGADFFEISQAVGAASDGDLVLVREGSYGPVSIVGKALTLQGDGPPGAVSVTGPFFAPGTALSVADSAADQEVVVRGISIGAFGLVGGELCMRVSGCDGPVVFEDCDLSNRSGVAVEVFGAASVSFHRCTVDAGDSFFDSFINTFQEREGMKVGDANVFLYDSSVQGSVGHDALVGVFVPDMPPGPGGDGIRFASSGSLFASGSTIAGGGAGSGTPEVCSAGFDGGAGIHFGAANAVRLLDTSVTAGGGGLGSCGLANGTAGVALEGPAGSLQTLPGTARSFAIGSPVREGGAATLHYAGEAGDLVFLVVGARPIPGFYLTAFHAALHVSPPFATIAQGTLPASGALDVVVPIGSLPPGVELARFVGQAVMIGSGGVFHAGPSTAVLLDGAF